MLFQAYSISFWILLLLEYKSAPFNSWITRRVRNESLWALRYANVSPGLDVISRLCTKAPDIKTTTVVDRSFPFGDHEVLNVHCAQSFVMILYLLEEYKLFTCGLLMFQISTMANFETEFMHFWSFLTRPGDKHDEGISKCTSTPLQAGPSSRFSRFCRESHDFLTFLTTRLPISWILKKHHSEMKHFFGWIKAEMFTVFEL